MLYYICSPTITTTAKYYLLPWKGRQIVQCILGEISPFSANGWSGCAAGWDCVAVPLGLQKILLGNLCLQSAVQIHPSYEM